MVTRVLIISPRNSLLSRIHLIDALLQSQFVTKTPLQIAGKNLFTYDKLNLNNWHYFGCNALFLMGPNHQYLDTAWIPNKCNLDHFADTRLDQIPFLRV